MKSKKQEYKDIIKYCTDRNRAVPLEWCKVMTILDVNKRPKGERGGLHSLVLAYSRHYTIEEKIKRFHDQIGYGLFYCSTNKYNELKEFLLNLKREDWLYKNFEEHKNKEKGFNMYQTKSRLSA
jgi:hypothetical protein